MRLAPLAIALLLAGCGFQREQLNPGAATPWIHADQAEVQARAWPPGQLHVVACCKGDAIYEMPGNHSDLIYVHEFCHLVDHFTGDYHAALASLESPADTYAWQDRIGVIRRFCATLDKLHCGHWQLIARQYGTAAGVQHPEIINTLKGK